MGRAEDIFAMIKKNGITAIDEFIMNRKSEELFLDFKRSADNGGGFRLHQNDRNNLAKAISGFGNSEGGVIVWGIDCSSDVDFADVARAKLPIQNVVRYVSWLEGAISGCTIPPHTGIQNEYILAGESNDGFAITYIPKSNNAPHQTIYNMRYYIRAGSDFVPIPHAVLAGMFGRRPQPIIFQQYVTEPAEVTNKEIRIALGILICNSGPGIASDLFMNLKIYKIPGNNCVFSFDPIDATYWFGQFTFGIFASVISRPEIRLSPENQLKAFVLRLSFVPPFEEDLLIDGICGCNQSPTYRFRIENSKSLIKNSFNKYLKKYHQGTLSDEDRTKLVNEILNI